MIKTQHYLFDWGDTLMVDIPNQTGPMCDWPEIKVVDGASECLAALSYFANCHLATNALNSNESEIKAAFSRAGLNQYIDTIFCADSIGFSKPEPEYFQFILARLDVPKSNIVLIGDSLEKDIQGALKMGIDAIWYNPLRLAVPKGIRAISKLTELTKLHR
jgi:putative hydrolase of the HAD superfamily